MVFCFEMWVRKAKEELFQLPTLKEVWQIPIQYINIEVRARILKLKYSNDHKISNLMEFVRKTAAFWQEGGVF